MFRFVVKHQKMSQGKKAAKTLTIWKYYLPHNFQTTNARTLKMTNQAIYKVQLCKIWRWFKQSLQFQFFISISIFYVDKENSFEAER
jgi:hypothetical protein